MRKSMAGAEDYPNRSSPRQRWALTKEAFDRLIAALDSDVELAGEKYLMLRRNLVRYFEGRGCRLAEDHADETINRLAKRLDEGEPVRDLNSYCYGVARLLLLEVFKEREREESALKQLPRLYARQSDPAEIDESGRRLECLNSCLEKLPADNRRLIIEYYQGSKGSKIENRKQLADALGLQAHALRSRAVRLREKLESCISNCLKKKPAATA